MKQNVVIPNRMLLTATKLSLVLVAVALGCFLVPSASGDDGDHNHGQGQGNQDGQWQNQNDGQGQNQNCGQGQNQNGCQGGNQGEGNDHGHGHGHQNGHGTDILHLQLCTAMVNVAATNNAVETNATGKVIAKQNEQGNANIQCLDISMQNLETNATYELFALVDDETNLTFVVDFTTDENGNADLNYSNNAHGDRKAHANGHGHGKGHGKGHGNGQENGGNQEGGDQSGQGTLPASLNPISQIQQLTVFNSSTQAVLTADLTMPDRFQYLVKRNLSTNGIDACLRIMACTNQTQFRLSACGLSPTNDYFLVLNGGIAETNSTDASGCVTFNTLPSGTQILQVNGLALTDSSNNVVLSTTLP